MAPADDLRRIVARIHDALALLLILLRPSIWDGESASWPALIWYGLLTTAVSVLACEYLSGWRTSVRWGWAGVVAGALLLVLLPAAWYGPEGYDALALWAQWAGHLILAGYLLQIITGRERLLIAALVAGLAVQTTYALGQAAWSLPHMAAQASSGTLAVGVLQADLQERIANGGVFGSFTISNALAAYLILILPVVIGMAWRQGRPGPRVMLALIAVITVVAVVLTRSKGAIAALATATLIIAWWHGTPRWRLGVGALVVMGVLATWLSPDVRTGIAASAQVRWDYWQAAGTLIAEQPLNGYGIGGYAAHAARVLPLGAEYSRHVHNELLDATVMGGLLAGLLASVWFLLLARRPQQLDLTATTPSSPALLLMIVPVIALPYLHVFGLLPGEGWPTSVNGLALLPMVALGALAGAVAWAAMQCRLPPAWAVHLGLIGCLGHALIDFDLHAGGVVGPLVVLAVLAGHGRTQMSTRRWWRPVPAVVAVALAAALIVGGARGRTLRATQDLVLEVAALPGVARTDPARFAELLAYRHRDLGLPPPTPAQATPRGLAALLEHTVRRSLPIMQQWPPASPSIRVAMLQRLPAGADRLSLSQAFVDACPWLARAHRLLAEDLAATGNPAEAISSVRRAIAKAPWHLPHQQALIPLLRATGAEDEAQQVAARIAELTPLVYFRDRPETPDPAADSGAPASR